MLPRQSHIWAVIVEQRERDQSSTAEDTPLGVSIRGIVADEPEGRIGERHMQVRVVRIVTLSKASWADPDSVLDNFSGP